MMPSKNYGMSIVMLVLCCAQSLSAAVEVKLTKQEPTRALEQQPGPTFGTSAFDNGTGYFGATSKNPTANALVRATLIGDAKSGYTLPATSLAGDNKKPLYDQQIAFLSLANGQPTVVKNDDTALTVVSPNDGSAVRSIAANTIRDAGGSDKDVIRIPPKNLTGAQVGDSFLAFAAVSDTKNEPAIAWAGAPGARAGAVDYERAIRDAFDAVKTNPTVGATTIAVLAPQILDDPTKNATGLTYDALVNAIRDTIGAKAVFDTTKAPVTLKVNNTIGAVVGNVGSITKQAATLLSVTREALKTAVGEKAGRTANAAVHDNATTAAKVAEFVTTGAIAAGPPIGAIDRGDSLTAGAAAAIEGGVAWATRKAGVGDNGAAVKVLFNDGATAVYDIYNGAGDKEFSEYASGKVKDVDAIQASAASLIKFVGPLPGVVAAWESAKGVNARIQAAAAAAADTTGNNLDAVAEKTVAVLKDTYNIAHDAVVLNAKTAADTDAAGDPMQGKMALAAQETKQATFLNTLVKNDAGNFAIADTITAGSVVALEAALAKAVGSYVTANDAENLKNAASTVANVKDFMNNILGIRRTDNTLIKTLATNNALIATNAAEKIKVAVNANSDLDTTLYSVVQPTVEPLQWLDKTTAKNREAAAWRLLGNEVRTQEGAGSINYLANKAVKVGGANAIKGIFTKDAASAANCIWTVAQQATKAEAAAQAATIVSVNNEIRGVAAAIAAALGWGIRCATIGATQEQVESAVKEAIEGLAVPLAANKAAAAAAARLAVDKNAANAFRAQVATSLQNAIKTGTGDAAIGVAAAIAKGKNDAEGIVEQLKSEVPYLREEIITAAAQKQTLEEVRTSIDTGALLGISNTKADGMRGALEAALVWGANNYALDGQYWSSVTNAEVNIAASIADSIQAKATTAATAVYDALNDRTTAQAGAKAVVDALANAAFKGKISDVITMACGDNPYTSYFYSYKPGLDQGFLEATSAADADNLAILLHDIEGINKNAFRTVLKDNREKLYQIFNKNTLKQAVLQARALFTYDDVNQAAAVGVLGALGVGVRNMHVVCDPAWQEGDVVDSLDVKIAKNLEAKIVKPMIGLVYSNVDMANANIRRALQVVYNEGDRSNAVRLKIAQIILDAAKVGHKSAAEKARVLANMALLVNNLVYSPNFTIDQQALVDKIEADNTGAEKKVLAVAKAADSQAAATVAKGYALADAGAAGNLTVAGAAAALEASLGWGVRNATMANTAADIKDFLNKGDDSGILDRLTGDVAAGGYDPRTHYIANDIASKIKTDHGAPAAANKTIDEVVARIQAGVKTGTGVATEAMVTEVKKYEKAVLGQAATQLKVNKGALVLNAGRTQAAAAAAAVDGAAVASIPGAGLADTLAGGATAALEAAIGWTVKQVKDGETKGTLLDFAVRPWATGAYNDGEQRGIAVLKPAAAGAALEEVGDKAANIVVEAKADDVADRTVAFYAAGGADVIAGAYMTGETVSMYWDKDLERLFVGLQGVQRGKKDASNTTYEAAPDKQGGIVGVLVGTVGADKQVTFAPVVNEPTAAKLGPVENRGVIGFYSLAQGAKPAGGAKALDDTVQTTIWNLRTMHTSTGKNYLIVNGGTDKEDADEINQWKTWVSAFPIMGSGDHAGQLAKTDGTKAFTVAGDGELLKTIGLAAFAVNVGRDPRLIGGNTTEKLPAAMEVVGDTVYVAMAEARQVVDAAGAPNERIEAGIFASTAIFDANGLIADWTPWKRVGGTTDKVHGFGMAPTAATALYLTGNAKDTIKSSAWGESGQVVSNAVDSRALTDALEKVFSDVGGVFQLYNFDENTPGFAPGKFSMMVAVGPDRVALIETARFDAVLKPTTKFATVGADQRVFVFKASDSGCQALKDIMPLTCAEVLRDKDNANYGYLYIGGYKGLARLELAAGANGWINTDVVDRLEKLQSGNASEFPYGKTGAGGAKAWTFTKVNAWNGSCVLGMAGAGNKTLQVLSLEKVTKLGKIATDNAQTGNLTSKSLDNAEGQYGCDMVLVNNKVIAATTNGLYVTSADMDKDFVKVRADLLPATMVPVQLAYISSDLEKNSDKGDLYVLAISREKEESKVYRFAVDKDGAMDYDKKTQAVVNDINGQTKFPMKLSNYARQFATDGSVLLAVRSTVPGVTDVVQVGMMRGGGKDDVAPLSAATLNINTNKQAAYVARPVKDSATGAWIVPGDFYARVNE